MNKSGRSTQNIMAAKKLIKSISIFVIFSILLLLIVINVRGGFWKDDEGIGGGFLKQDGKTVEYSYRNGIVNISVFPKTVTFEAFSYEDAEISFIREPELKVVSVGIYSGKEPGDIYYLPENAMTLQPFKEYWILIECEGEYGGNGKGVRHPPDTVKIKRLRE